jgi:hypothetical protein
VRKIVEVVETVEIVEVVQVVETASSRLKGAPTRGFFSVL